MSPEVRDVKGASPPRGLERPGVSRLTFALPFGVLVTLVLALGG